MNDSGTHSRRRPFRAAGTGVIALAGCTISETQLHILSEQVYAFDARGVAKRFRHAAIFGALDALHPGETMRFTNDHDPIPLLQQLQQRYGTAVTINYVICEPGAIVIDFARQ